VGAQTSTAAEPLPTDELRVRGQPRGRTRCSGQCEASHPWRLLRRAYTEL